MSLEHLKEPNLMARKIVNRKALRDEVTAAEAAGVKDKKTVAKKTPAKKAAKRKSRAKSAVELRKKMFWGVFSQSLKRVALFEFSEKQQADEKAQELNKSGKSPHFVQKVVEEIAEE